jgi:hypothetical protein
VPVADLERLLLQAAPVGIARQHPVEVGGEQAGLLAARARPDLDDHVLLVVRVRLDHRQPDLLLELPEPLLRGAQELTHLGVVAVLGQQLACARRVVGRAAPLLGQPLGRLERPVGAADLGVAPLVAHHLRVRHLLGELVEAALDLLHEPLDHADKGTTPAAGGSTGRRPQRARSANSSSWSK